MQVAEPTGTRPMTSDTRPPKINRVSMSAAKFVGAPRMEAFVADGLEAIRAPRWWRFGSCGA